MGGPHLRENVCEVDRGIVLSSGLCGTLSETFSVSKNWFGGLEGGVIFF